jgi:hypothetical protein
MGALSRPSIVMPSAASNTAMGSRNRAAKGAAKAMARNSPVRMAMVTTQPVSHISPKSGRDTEKAGHKA